MSSLEKRSCLLLARICQFFTGNENRAILTRVSKRIKEAADHPLAWSEHVVLDFQHLERIVYQGVKNLFPPRRPWPDTTQLGPIDAEDFKPIQALAKAINKECRAFNKKRRHKLAAKMIHQSFKQQYQCKSLQLRHARNYGDLVCKYVVPTKHIKLDFSHLSCAAIPDTVDTLTEDGCSLLDGSRMQIKTVHNLTGQAAVPGFLLSYPCLETFYITKPNITLPYWNKDKYLILDKISEIDYIPQSLKLVVWSGWNKKDHPHVARQMSRMIDWFSIKRPDVKIDTGGCSYVPIGKPV